MSEVPYTPERTLKYTHFHTGPDCYICAWGPESRTFEMFIPLKGEKDVERTDKEPYNYKPTQYCAQCGAVVAIETISIHRRWHAKNSHSGKVLQNLEDEVKSLSNNQTRLIDKMIEQTDDNDKKPVCHWWMGGHYWGRWKTVDPQFDSSPIRRECHRCGKTQQKYI